MSRITPLGRARSSALVAVAPTLHVLLGVLVALTCTRVWLPSVLVVHGGPREASAVGIGLFAAVPFLLAVSIAPPGVALLQWRVLLVGAAGVLAAGRLVLQTSPGGDPQLIVATLAVAVGVLWTAAVAASPLQRQGVAVGVVAGVALDAVAGALLRSEVLPWRDGVVGWLLTVTIVAAFLGTGWVAVRPATPGRAAVPPAGPAWPWLLIGPAVVLHLLVAPAARLHTVTGWHEGVVAFVVVVAGVGAVVAAAARLRLPTRNGGVVAAVLVVAGLYATVAVDMPFEVPPVLAAGHLLTVLGIGAALAGLGRTTSTSSPARRAAVATVGWTLGMAALLLHNAAGELAIEPTAVLWGAAGMLALLAVLGRTDPEELPYPWAPGRAAAGVVSAVGLLTVVVVPLAASSPSAPGGDGLPLRVLTLDVNAGFHPSGVHDLDRLAAVIAEESPDVVALQDVSRGWYLAGAVDLLPRLAERLEMEHAFAPGADRLLGNAVLSRYPIVDVRDEPLPREGTAATRSALTAVVDAGGTELAVISTELHPVAADEAARRTQAERVAGIARDLRDQGVPVVLAGDLGAPPDDPGLEPLGRELANASGSGAEAASWPAGEPAEALDQIWVSGDLGSEDVTVLEAVVSDHRPVAATVRATG